MMEKQNRTLPLAKDASGDSGVLDDLVDFASKKMGKTHATDPSKRNRPFAGADAAPVPVTEV